MANNPVARLIPGQGRMKDFLILQIQINLSIISTCLTCLHRSTACTKIIPQAEESMSTFPLSKGLMASGVETQIMQNGRI